jgi:hypothetical protein
MIFSRENHKNIVDSAIATTIAEIITLPICTVKTNYQNGSFSSIKTTIKTLYNQHGISVFYRASIPSIGSQVFSTTSKYVIYRNLEDNKYFNKFTNGLISGVISSIFTHPMDFIKIHKQMSSPLLPELIKSGPLLFYRGYSKTISKISVGSLLFFPLYDTFYLYFNKGGINGALLASVSSAITSTLIIHPIDYLKTRHIYDQKLYQGINPYLYYKGLSLNLLRIVPHFTIVMTVIDFLRKY